MYRFLAAALAAVVLLSSAAAPARAQDGWCEELWLNRNLIFDRAGYCFGSALGQALFDNSDCTTQSPALDAADAEGVALIRAAEGRANCSVDTSATTLGADAMTLLRRLRALDRIPARDEFESACIGYQGPTVALRSGPSGSAAIIGEIGPGVTVGFAHLPIGDWSYVTTHDGTGVPMGHGYIRNEIFATMPCRMMAG